MSLMINQGLTLEQCKALYLDAVNRQNTETLRQLCKEDLYFLIYVGFKRRDVEHQWLYERCREVEADPDGYLDLWARDHYKSTIITFAKTIQDILNNPNITIGIFSHTRPIAKGFLNQIKIELESNDFLKRHFTDVLYDNPRAESKKWSLDEGLVVRRDSNPKEPTLSAWGLVDGQPTSKHFDLLVYDDIVTRESVTTPEQIKKVTEALELSYNLGTKGGKRRFIGTRYHANDTYKTIMERGTVKPRIHTATKDGTDKGEPVLLSKEELLNKRRDMGPYTFNCQMLQNAMADKSMSFKEEWLNHYTKELELNKLNIYIVVDPANEKKSSSDYTVFEVIGLGPDQNYYLIDAVRDRLNLTERTECLFKLHRKYKPLKVGYEKYGMQSDVEHIKYVMELENYRFQITTLGGNVPKNDRIRRLVPIYEQGRFYTPKKLLFTDYEGRSVDYVERFEQDEFLTFPVCAHDDMLDCRARILDLGASFPKEIKKQTVPNYYNGDSGTSWMG